MPVHALRAARGKHEWWLSDINPSSSYPEGRVRQATAASEKISTPPRLSWRSSGFRQVWRPWPLT